MSAAVLKEAARLMHERAKDATYVYASHHRKAGQVVPWFDAADAYSFDETDGPHIMGWSPVVALAVAKAMDDVAQAWEIADGWTHDLDEDPIRFEDTIDGGWLTVARAYLEAAS